MIDKKRDKRKKLVFWILLFLSPLLYHYPLHNNLLNIHLISKEVEKIKIADVRDVGNPFSKITFTYVTDRDTIDEFVNKTKYRFNFIRYKNDNSKREYLLTFYYENGLQDTIGYDKKNKVLYYPWKGFKLQEDVFIEYDKLIEASKEI